MVELHKCYKVTFYKVTMSFHESLYVIADTYGEAEEKAKQGQSSISIISIEEKGKAII